MRIGVTKFRQTLNEIKDRLSLADPIEVYRKGRCLGVLRDATPEDLQGVSLASKDLISVTDFRGVVGQLMPGHKKKFTITVYNRPKFIFVERQGEEV